MTNQKFLHVAGADVFIPPYIEFIQKHFDPSDHQFLLSYGKAAEQISGGNNIYLAKKGAWAELRYLLKFILTARKADKIIFHGFFNHKATMLLMLQPWLHKKSYWVIWGGDLYAHSLAPRTTKWYITEFVKKAAIKRVGHLITHIKGDYELAQLWYQARGRWHECFMYPSNLYRDYPIQPKPHQGINILLGNSAAPTNNHLEALEKLRPYVDQDIRIYCPLSYGDGAYADKVSHEGQAIFGTRFIALRDFMPFARYLELLSEIDIAIFNHNRQQAMGNLVTLLGLGKKVFMRSDITSFATLNSLDLNISCISSVELSKLSSSDALRNRAIISKYFSEDNLKKQLELIFY